MTNRTYEYFEKRYNEVKPIRGRSEDIRPIDKRRRDFELIVRGVESADIDGNVVYWYGAKLWQTVVVKYFSNGEIELNCGGWRTPSTADFMHNWAPYGVIVRKERGNLWVRMNNVRGNQSMIPKDSPLRLKEVDGKWQAVNAPVLKQQVVDRSKMKEARESVRPFLDFSKTMLKLSDGWVMANTLEQYRSKEQNAWWWVTYDFGFDIYVKEVLRGGGIPTHAKRLGQQHDGKNNAYYKALDEALAMMRSNDTETWQRVMYQICDGIQPIERRLVRKEPITVQDDRVAGFLQARERDIYDEQIPLTAFIRKVDNILKCLDVHTIRIVEGDKVRDNLVS